MIAIVIENDTSTDSGYDSDNDSNTVDHFSCFGHETTSLYF